MLSCIEPWMKPSIAPGTPLQSVTWRVERMGLPEHDERDIEVAKILLQQRESIYGKAA